MVNSYLDSNIHLMLITYTIAMLVSVFSLCYLVMKSGKTPLRASFSIAQGVIIIWLMFSLLEIVSITFAEKLFIIRVSLICVNFMAPLWLITMLFYTKRLTKKNYSLIPTILSVPLAMCAPLLFPAYSVVFRLYIKEIQWDGQIGAMNITWGFIPSISHVAAFIFLILLSYILLDFFRKKISINII